MDPKKANDILAKQLPGYELVEEVTAPETPDSDTQAHPSLKTWSKFGAGTRPRSDAKRDKLAALREKFLGGARPAAAEAPPPADTAPAPDADPGDCAMLLVKKKGSNAKPKAVFVENGKIITRQG
jgi:hypothetical protein